MNIQAQREVYQKILSLTLDDNPITLKKIQNETKITGKALEEILFSLHSFEIISKNDVIIRLAPEQRIKLAVKLVELGGDLRKISNKLGWLEFEEFVARVFEENGFNVMKRFRFHAKGRRWEIDLIAKQYPFIVCAECKHWTRGIGNSVAQKIIETHLEKTEVFRNQIDELGKRIMVQRWKQAIIIPIALTLNPTRIKIYHRTPSVSVLALPTFLNEFRGYLEQIVHFLVELPEYQPEPKQTKLR